MIKTLLNHSKERKKERRALYNDKIKKCYPSDAPEDTRPHPSDKNSRDVTVCVEGTTLRFIFGLEDTEWAF